jgi:hypothetical protein
MQTAFIVLLVNAEKASTNKQTNKNSRVGSELFSDPRNSLLTGVLVRGRSMYWRSNIFVWQKSSKCAVK